MSVLSARRALLGPHAPPLPVTGPWPLRKWLQAFDQGVQRLGFEFILLPETTEGAMAAAQQAEEAGGAGGAPHGARALARPSLLPSCNPAPGRPVALSSIRH